MCNKITRCLLVAVPERFNCCCVSADEALKGCTIHVMIPFVCGNLILESSPSIRPLSLISTFMTFAQWPDLAIYCLHTLIALTGLTMYLTVQAHTHFFFKSPFENAFILSAKKGSSFSFTAFKKLRLYSESLSF